ncbi:DUF561 domain-containing protein [Pseudogracilibacillus sp. SE30717A]|uniref:NAD(P)H-dependent flavin oxidoreductase n=1 Tax=Pseudogracilibacillus sp. SE30717A TaxID=3098293 RepID=UPI00300E02E7
MKSEISNLLNITYPIIQGGMGNISNAKLTAAVSEAGGLGTIGCGTMEPSEVEKIILETKKCTKKPFAVNIAINVTPHTDALIKTIIKHKVPVVSLSAGNPAPYIPILKENGIKILTIVAAVKHAVKAEAAGADAVVAEGFEAAGINSNLELTTMTLIPQIVDRVNIPVIAAGGIGDGRGLSAALMLGASGIQMGTRFIATKEAPFHENYKNAILQATDTSTKIIGRNVGQTRRVVENEYANKISQLEADGMTAEEFWSLTTEAQHRKGAIKGNFTDGFINGGQVSGLISDLPTVEELLTEMMRDAQAQIENVRMLF